MKTKVTMLIFLAVLFFPGIATVAAAGTAAEFDRDGLEHFRLAFYELTPRKDVAGAAREFRLAAASFREAIRLEPGWVEPYLHLGRSCFVQKKYRQAAGYYQQALELAPEHREISLQLASSLEMARQYRQAIEILIQLRGEQGNEDSVRLLDELIQRLEKKAVQK